MNAESVTIRAERPEDVAAIADVVTRAFGQPDEAKLVERIRAADRFDPSLSLVAATRADDALEDSIVGHILFSPIVIDRGGGGRVDALSLAPMAVAPEYQNRGIGTRLVHAGLEAARSTGHRIAIVLGHDHYYPRFGFIPASRHNILPPFDAPDAAFMALALQPGSLDHAAGVVRYPAAFNDV